MICVGPRGRELHMCVHGCGAGLDVTWCIGCPHIAPCRGWRTRLAVPGRMVVCARYTGGVCVCRGGRGVIVL